MFTGIVEVLGEVVEITKNQENIVLQVQSSISSEFKIDQSVAHNGVCLTVTKVDADKHEVVAIKETLDKSNIGLLKVGDKVNLERALKMGDRLDGHMVQGHVDTTAICQNVTNQDGSYVYRFELKQKHEGLLVEKGSICLNGISLTVFDVTEIAFSVAIIPYTFEHTNIQYIKLTDSVNIEFDMMGKYIKQLMGKNDN